MVTLIKILVKIIKIQIAMFKLSGWAQDFVDYLERRYLGL